MLEDCFYHLSNFPLLDQKYVEEGINAVYPNLPKPEDPEAPTPRAITVESSFQNTVFFKNLEKQFGPMSCVYIRSYPMSTYDWHRDIFKMVTINFILHDVKDSLVLFRDKVYGVERMQYNIKPAVYTPLKPTILDTRLQHCVINLNNDYRYILNLGFLDNKIYYKDVKNYLTNIPVPEYY